MLASGRANFKTRRERVLHRFEMEQTLKRVLLRALDAFPWEDLARVSKEDLVEAYAVSLQTLQVCHQCGDIEAHQAVARRFRMLKMQLAEKGFIKEKPPR